MPKCKKCKRNMKEGQMSAIFIKTVWIYCAHCIQGEYFKIPEYIPKEQYKRFLSVKV